MGFGHNSHSHSHSHSQSHNVLPHSGASNERAAGNNKHSGAFYKPSSASAISASSVVDGAMEPRNAGVLYEAGHAQRKRKEKKHASKLGGFFSRLASFRFSLRKGATATAADEKDRKSEAGNKSGES